MRKTTRIVKIIAVFIVVMAIMLGNSDQAFARNAVPVKATSEGANGIYVVRMIEEPVLTYTGGVQGYKATAPAKNQKIDPFSDVVLKYAGYLDARHNDALNAVGGGRKLYDYRYTYNGFAAELSSDQAAKMASVAGVLSISPDELFEVDTSSTPNFLGLDAPGGLWEQLGGVGSAGDGIIIGVIDSGIWPENPSFSDRTGWNGNFSQDGKLDYHQIPGWHGKCVPGEDFNASLCNQKLIGAQYFNESWGGNAGIDAQRPWEFNSARDYNGHGTHTSSTAGGNYGVQVLGPASIFGTINGIAPHARIAMYKALWSTEDASTASGSTSDLVAAIDQAVADGVDVINYSISGTQTNFRDPVEIAFMVAADAGVFVAASAGNSGPTASTVAHPGPWITTVAAGTHNRSVVGSVTLGNGETYTGVSLATAAVTAPLIDSVNAGLPGADPTQVELCYSSLDGGNVLDPAKVAGKIVLCKRGVTARVNKSLAVLEAGGVGLVLYNNPDNTLNADFHSVPTVHINSAAGLAVKAYAALTGATATINVATIDYTTPAPFTASFSSRGPLRAGNGDLLKPDLMAPGVDILAAVSPASGSHLDFNIYSGTSMSSPHVAGLAALLMDLHPDWTPMMIKSALMTSAYDILDGSNTNPLVIFRQGAGHVRPNSAADPGLVYNSGWNDWLGFLCGTQLPASYCTSRGIPVLDPSNFNAPSIAIGDLAGIQKVTRTVTNVGAKETYTFSYSGLAGITVTPSITSFTLASGNSQSYEITFTAAGATLNAYVGGYITWSGNQGHVVRIPVVIRPVALAAPVQVSGNYNVTFGYTGPFTATPRGLVPAISGDDEIYTGQSNAYSVVIPAGTTYARFALFDANVSPASDLDLYVYRGSTLVGSSGSGTSTEEVNLVNPVAATYTVVVDGYATGDPTTFTLFIWLLGTANAGNMAVSAPSAAVTGTTGAINLTFSGLTPGVKYLGSIAYGGAAGMPNPTIVRVDP